MTMTKNNKTNLTQYQEDLKHKNLEKIDRAINELHQKHLPLSVTSIAYESGLSRQAMYTPYIKTFLQNHPLLSEKNSDEPETVETLKANIQALKMQIENLEKQKTEILNKKKELNAENQKLHEQLSQLSEKYSVLLGQYITDIEKKVIKF